MVIRFVRHVPGAGSYVVAVGDHVLFGPATFSACVRYMRRDPS